MKEDETTLGGADLLRVGQVAARFAVIIGRCFYAETTVKSWGVV